MSINILYWLCLLTGRGFDSRILCFLQKQRQGKGNRFLNCNSILYSSKYEVLTAELTKFKTGQSLISQFIFNQNLRLASVPPLCVTQAKPYHVYSVLTTV